MEKFRVVAFRGEKHVPPRHGHGKKTISCVKWETWRQLGGRAEPVNSIKPSWVRREWVVERVVVCEENKIKAGVFNLTPWHGLLFWSLRKVVEWSRAVVLSPLVRRCLREGCNSYHFCSLQLNPRLQSINWLLPVVVQWEPMRNASSCLSTPALPSKS